MFPKSNIQRDKLYYPSCYCAHGNNGFLWIYSGWYELILNKDCRMTNKQKWKISQNRNNAPNDHLKGVNASSVFLNHIRQTNCCWQKNIQITSLYISPECGSPCPPICLQGGLRGIWLKCILAVFLSFLSSFFLSQTSIMLNQNSILALQQKVQLPIHQWTVWCRLACRCKCVVFHGLSVKYV